MKLSAKTALIFVITTIIGGMVYILAGTYLSEYFYERESERIIGIVKSNILHLEEEIHKQFSSDYIENKPSLEGAEPLVIKESIEKNILALILFEILVSIVIYYILWCLINKVIIKRINCISREVRLVKDSLNFTQRIEVAKGNDEIAILSKDINEMIGELDEGYKVLLENEKKYRRLFKSMSNGVARYRIIPGNDPDEIDAICEEVNTAFLELYSMEKEDIIGTRISHISWTWSKNNLRALKSIVDSISMTGEHFRCGEVEVKPGVWADMTFYVVEDGSFDIIWTNITEFKQYGEQMKYMAEYDGLTGLLNRYSMTSYMEALDESYTVYFMDLDNFKNINDALGHHIGDEVLCSVAKDLKTFQCRDVKIARLGGDEFVILRKGDYTEEEQVIFGERILEKIGKTYTFDHYTFTIEGSIGISSYPLQTSDPKHLLRYADIAMYKSKELQKGSCKVFTKEMLEEIELEAELREALTREELQAYYQPIYDVKKGKIVGAEALVRWIRGGKVIPLYKVLSIAKKSGDIIRIDQMMLQKACQFCKEQRKRGYGDFKVAINASSKWLMQPHLIETIKETLETTGLEPEGLKLEITEDQVIENPKYVITLLNELRAMGISTALDDFGIGYSSFNHIKMLPLDILKIDRSLLLEVEDDGKSKEIIQMLIHLSHALGLEVVCEGVETQEQMDLLINIKCDKIQGYFISEPVSEEEFIELIEKGI